MQLITLLLISTLGIPVVQAQTEGLDKLSNPLVKTAVKAMQDNDRDTWMKVFSAKAVISDDGKERDFIQWSDSEIFGRLRAYIVLGKSRGYFKRIDKEENKGTSVYGYFHTDRWGEFNTYMHFKIENNQIIRLDVGQIKQRGG
ncbi:hypothetical protein HA050_06790 [Iodobacter sp. HSC-16F04]|uniref:Nuclear transport factor 2 family protein n=1 Tax=Iodobacter violaceini TaxID=3044271 RepID=A0ABX0KNH4_9NEIS|nr:hypothetical protein [Iodobacter violacea]NHQ85825.1 hypothetical protein [Iodobacter violacea]